MLHTLEWGSAHGTHTRQVSAFQSVNQIRHYQGITTKERIGWLWPQGERQGKAAHTETASVGNGAGQRVCFRPSKPTAGLLQSSRSLVSWRPCFFRAPLPFLGRKTGAGVETLGSTCVLQGRIGNFSLGAAAEEDVSTTHYTEALLTSCNHVYSPPARGLLIHCECPVADAGAGVKCGWKPGGRPKMMKKKTDPNEL